MNERLPSIARVLAIGLTAVVGVGLLAVTPMLLFFGGWTGSDAESVPLGFAIFLGVPWLPDPSEAPHCSAGGTAPGRPPPQDEDWQVTSTMTLNQ